MVGRQAGFATVMCVAETFVNDYLRAASENLPPPYVRLPTPIDVGGRPVTVEGDLRLEAPRVTLDSRADDRAGVKVRATGRLTLGTDAVDLATVAATLEASVLEGIAIRRIGDRFFIGLDTASATVEAGALTLSVGAGGLHSVYGTALHSDPVREALTMAIRSLPERLTWLVPDGIPASHRLAPPAMPCGASLFDVPPLFDAQLNIDRIEARPVDGALVAGLDFAGTHGDRDALENLFKKPGPVILRTTMNVELDRYEEWNVQSAVNVSGCSVGISVNPGAISSVVAGILTPAARYSFVDCHVALRDLGIAFGSYQEDPPLKPYWLPGAELHVAATYYSAPGRDPHTSKLLPGGNSADVQVRATMAMHRQSVYSAIRTDLNRSWWNLTVHHVDIDLPWWMTFGVVVAGVMTPVVNLMPAVTIAAALFSLNSLKDNLEGILQGRAQAGINGAMRQISLGRTRDNVHLPGLPEPIWAVILNALSMTDQGLDLFATYAPKPRAAARPDAALTVVYDGRTIHDGDTVDIPAGGGSRTCEVTLDPAVADPSDSGLSLQWTSRGGIDGVVGGTVGVDRSSDDGPYARTRRFNVPHAEYVPYGTEGGYDVSIRVYKRWTATESIELGRCNFYVKANDRFAEGGPYVRWEHHVNGYFEPNWHGDHRVSAIHWTDPEGRCAMLDRATHQLHRVQYEPPRYETPFKFLDWITFPSDPDFAEYKYADDPEGYQARLAELIAADRDMLCDYCFFGGPDKTTLRAPIITQPEDFV